MGITSHRWPRLPARFTSIAVRIPAVMALVAMLLLAVSSTAYLWTTYSLAFLEDLAERDLRGRDAVTRLSADTEQFNTRLLGVMAKVYSSPGSADRARALVAAISAGWTRLADAIPAESRPDGWADAQAAIATLDRLAPQLDAALRASKPLDEGFDTWLEVAAALRKVNQQVTQALDTRIRTRVADDIDLARWAVLAIAGLTGLSLLILGAVAWSLIAGVSRPIARITEIMVRLSAGDTDAKPEGRARTDEIGSMARAVDVFRESIIHVRMMTEAEQRASATREQRARAMQGYTRDFSGAVAGVMGSFSTSASDMRAAAASVQATSVETVAMMDQVSATSAESASNLSAVASASEQMLASIGEIRRQIGDAAAVSADAVQASEHTTTLVNSLGDAARQVGDVVQLIERIAAQTNLLALNATIEAARAGESGKGFAVVATEVKNLAGQTARATTAISERIRQIQDSTGAAIGSVAAVAKVVGMVDQIASTIVREIDEQTLAVQEIVRNVQLANAGTGHSAVAVTGVAARSTGAAQDAAIMLSAADDVSNKANELRREVESFLDAMATTNERRSFDRFACRIAATAQLPGGMPMEAEAVDISRVGARLVPALPIDIGSTFTLRLAGVEKAFQVRVARQEADFSAVTFRETPGLGNLIDQLAKSNPLAEAA